MKRGKSLSMERNHESQKQKMGYIHNPADYNAKKTERNHKKIRSFHTIKENTNKKGLNTYSHTQFVKEENVGVENRTGATVQQLIEIEN